MLRWGLNPTLSFTGIRGLKLQQASCVFGAQFPHSAGGSHQNALLSMVGLDSAHEVLEAQAAVKTQV